MTTDNQNIERLIKEAPVHKHKDDNSPALCHEEAYDFVAYDWPRIKKYIRSLQKENDWMGRCLGDNGIDLDAYIAFHSPSRS